MRCVSNIRYPSLVTTSCELHVSLGLKNLNVISVLVKGMKAQYNTCHVFSSLTSFYLRVENGAGHVRNIRDMRGEQAGDKMALCFYYFVKCVVEKIQTRNL